ncbi:AmmeMemoRadiSam system protein B [Desulfobacterota bacterium M19]
MIRLPAVAGQFYPADGEELRSLIAGMSSPVAAVKPYRALAAVVPHAGYVYSGAVAAQTFQRIEIPPVVVVTGPNHHGIGADLALMREGCWRMPMGEVNINSALADNLLGGEVFSADYTAHLKEHSLEVQIPFLQYFSGELEIVPICASYITYAQCRRAGEELARAIEAWPQPVLMVASTDMTHYESRKIASRKDSLALDCIKNLDPEALYDTVIREKISMCGFIPVTIVLTAAVLLGASRAELVRYTDSGEVSGDIAQVVGYAGLIVS